MTATGRRRLRLVWYGYGVVLLLLTFVVHSEQRQWHLAVHTIPFVGYSFIIRNEKPATQS